MGVMNAVFPVTALYVGPLAVAFYWRWGRVGARGKRPWWAMMATELALTIAGATPAAEYVGDYVLALAFGIVFQYFAIAPMRGLGLKDGLKAAAKADFISLTFFEVGLFGWMAVMTFVLFPAPHTLMPSSASCWLLMQTGMIVGYATSWPANVWRVSVRGYGHHGSF